MTVYMCVYMSLCSVHNGVVFAEIFRVKTANPQCSACGWQHIVA